MDGVQNYHMIRGYPSRLLQEVLKKLRVSKPGVVTPTVVVVGPRFPIFIGVENYRRAITFGIHIEMCYFCRTESYPIAVFEFKDQSRFY